MVTSLYPRCPDVRNVDVTNQIAVWFCVLISLHATHVLNSSLFLGRRVSAATKAFDYDSLWPDQEFFPFFCTGGHDVFVSLPTTPTQNAFPTDMKF